MKLCEEEKGIVFSEKNAKGFVVGVKIENLDEKVGQKVSHKNGNTIPPPALILPFVKVCETY